MMDIDLLVILAAFGTMAGFLTVQAIRIRSLMALSRALTDQKVPVWGSNVVQFEYHHRPLTDDILFLPIVEDEFGAPKPQAAWENGLVIDLDSAPSTIEILSATAASALERLGRASTQPGLPKGNIINTVAKSGLPPERRAQ